MPAHPALTSKGACTCCGLVLLCLLSACSNTRPDTTEQDTLTVSAGAIDEATARADAMSAGLQQCMARDDRHASVVDMQVTPPAMDALEESTTASATTDALEAATTEGDAWHATLTFHCR